MEEEMRRVVPVIAQTRGAPRQQTLPLISIDTMKAAVAQAAVKPVPQIINDVTGLRDPAMREVVRATGAAAVAMHMQGMPRDMQKAPHYADVCARNPGILSTDF